tara:strand:- start:112 stop:546 length:435 start_codon:yes stop_codon:yes gene_type:complete
MTVTALWLQNPATVLLVAKGEYHPAVPYVRCIPRAEYWRGVGRQSGYNCALNRGHVLPVEYLRFNVHCPYAVDLGHTWRGARYAVASPLLAIGLIMTQGGSEWVERDMRRLFVDRADADKAAGIAIRSLERLGRSTGTLTPPKM